MAEKIIDRYGLKWPRDKELVRQLAIVFVREKLKVPPGGVLIMGGAP
jgi:hypothetical protein